MGRKEKRERKERIKENNRRAALRNDKSGIAFFLEDAMLWATEKEKEEVA